MARGSTRSGDRNQTGGDRYLPDRGYGLWRRGDRYQTDRWLGLTGGVTPPVTGLNDGDPVSLWADSSGHGHDASQSGSARPILKTYVLNGLPVVRLSSANSTTFNILSAIPGVSPWCAFVVMRVASPSISKNLTSLIGGVNSPQAATEYQGSFYTADRTGYIYAVDSWPNTFHIYFVRNDSPGQFSFYLDGGDPSNQIGSASPLQPNPSSNDWTRIGDINSDGDIAEILLYNTDVGLSVTNRSNICKYLGAKYGINVTTGTVIDPTTVPGLQGWWKADSLWTPPLLADGDPVSMWPDFSGFGHHATQTGSKRPILKKNILNGKPVVRFTTAGQSGLDLALPVSGAGDTTCFVVMKAVSNTVGLYSLRGDISNPYGPSCGGDGNIYSTSRSTVVIGPGDNTVFHIITADLLNGVYTTLYRDGTERLSGASPVSNQGDYTKIGYEPSTPYYSDGDIAEIIIYNSALAALMIKLKLIPLIPALITPGGPLTPPEQQEQEVEPEPMAAGDRANIEKYLGQKYGIAVAGGTAVDPTSIPGMMAWWKADAL